MFHAFWQPGHNSTDYQRFYQAAPGEIYKVSQYQSSYEPYVVFKKLGPPWCDERFVGYGANKAACLFEMYVSGISFYVLADHFMVHQNHKYEETARQTEVGSRISMLINGCLYFSRGGSTRKYTLTSKGRPVSS
jgi:hypothetical protein